MVSELIPEMIENPFLISIIIPTFNSSEKIGVTLESIKNQTYKNVEVIIVDASSTDRTLEVISDYSFLVSRNFSVTHYNPIEMMNSGISFARGAYITFLKPGSFYISFYALQTEAFEILKHQPDLLYTGCIQREIRRSSRYLNSPLNKEALEKGFQPTSITACLVKSELFDRVGRLDTHYPLRATLDFFSRVVKEEGIKVYWLDRIYVDSDEGFFSYLKLIRYAKESWMILKKQFGLFKAISWFLGLSHLRLFSFWIKHHKNRLTKI